MGVKRKVKFRKSLLDEWIDEGLVAKGDRLKNAGKRPVFRYGCRHYRRVLQVLRLYARGIKQIDEILIMLFINGDGVDAARGSRTPCARVRAWPRQNKRSGALRSLRSGRGHTAQARGEPHSEPGAG